MTLGDWDGVVLGFWNGHRRELLRGGGGGGTVLIVLVKMIHLGF